MTKYVLSALITFTFSFANAATPGVEIDLAKSTLAWSATKKVGNGHHGLISLKSATADIKNDQIVSGEFVVDMKSFTVAELEGEWHGKFMNHVSGADFFDVTKYPTAKLVIKGAEGKNKVKGDLTIKDKTQPVTVEFKKTGNAYAGKLTFDRTQYGVVYGSGNFFKELAADKIINNNVDVEFNILVKK